VGAGFCFPARQAAGRDLKERHKLNITGIMEEGVIHYA